MIYLKNNNTIQEIYIPKIKSDIKVSKVDKYEQGFADGVANQKARLRDLYVTENGIYEREDGYKTVTVDVPTESDTDCSDAYEQGKEEGYQEGYEDGAASIQIDLENKSIDIVSNGEYTVTPTDGFDALESVKISVDVPNEGNCNLEDKIIAPETNEVDGSGYIYIRPNEGYDGMMEVALQTDQLKNGWYNEGYEQGKEEGGECNLEEIINTPQISEVDEGYLYYTPSEGYNGLSRVVIQTGDLRNTWYNEGYESGRDFTDYRPFLSFTLSQLSPSPTYVEDSVVVDDQSVDILNLYPTLYYKDTEEITYGYIKLFEFPLDENTQKDLIKINFTEAISGFADNCNFQLLRTLILYGRSNISFHNSYMPSLQNIVLDGTVSLSLYGTSFPSSGTLWIRSDEMLPESLENITTELGSGWEVKELTDEMKWLIIG